MLGMDGLRGVGSRRDLGGLIGMVKLLESWTAFAAFMTIVIC